MPPTPEPVPPLPPVRSPWFLAGLAAPVVVLALALAWLGRPVERAPDAATKAIEKWLDKAGPEGPAVVVLGNSLAWSGTDRAVLGAAAGVPPARVVAATVTGSRAPTWTAVLKNRVLAAGHRPDVVVVGLTLEWLLNPSLHSPRQREILLGQLSGDDPVIQQVVFGKEPLPGPLRRAVDRRGTVRAATVDGIRGAVAELLVPEEDGEALLAEVFADDQLRGMDGPSGVMEALADGRPDAAALTRVAGARPPDQGMLPALLDLAAAHGLTLVLVRLPTSPGHAVDSAEALAHHGAVVEMVNASPHATWLDLSELPLRPADFADRLHYGPSGKAAVSAAIGTALGALGDGPLATAAVPAAPVRWARTDTLAPLALTISPKPGKPCLWQATVDDPRGAAVGEGPLLRQGLSRRSPFVLEEDGTPLERQDNAALIGKSDCDGTHLHLSRVLHFAPGAAAADDPAAHRYTLALRPETALPTGDDGADAWWVPPGSTLTGALDGRRSGTLSVLAVALGGPPAATLRLGDTDHPLAELGGGLVGLRLPLAPGAEGLALSVPADGPFLSLLDVTVTDAEGRAASLLDPQRDEAGVRRYLDGKATDPVAFTAGPPPALALPADPTLHKGKARFVGLPPLLADLAQLRDQLAHADSSPVALVEGDQTRATALPRCFDLSGLAPGAACHNDKALYMGIPEGMKPAQAAARYGLALRAERLHRRDLWLYPGDRARSTLHRRLFRALPYATNTLSLTALVPERPRGLLWVRLKDGEALLWETKLRVKELAAGPQRFALDPALRQSAAGFTLELELDAAASAVVVTDLTFSQSADQLWAAAGG